MFIVGTKILTEPIPCMELIHSQLGSGPARVTLKKLVPLSVLGHNDIHYMSVSAGQVQPVEPVLGDNSD